MTMQEAARDVEHMMAEKHELQRQVGSGKKAHRRASKRVEVAEQEACALHTELTDVKHKLAALKSHSDDLQDQVSMLFVQCDVPFEYQK